MWCDTTSSVEACALRARSTHGVHHAIVEVNIVIGVVLGEVLVARVVPLVVDAVVGLTLGLIAHVVIVVFVVAIVHKIFLYGRSTLYKMKVGGQILWNVTPICETSQIHYLMGRRPMKDVLGNHLTAKDQSRIHQFGKKVLPGLFLGYALYAEGIWKGDVLIADLEELETMDASEMYSRRLNAKEVIFPKQGEFIFPIANGRIKTLGGDQDLRTYTLVRHRPIQGESIIDILGETEGSLPQPQDSLPDAGEAINDFWSMSGSFIYRHHVEPRVKLYSPREESFPIPLEYIDVSRTTHTSLDVKQEKRIDDYWNIDGSRDLSVPWTGFTQFTLFDEKAPDGYMWSGGD